MSKYKIVDTCVLLDFPQILDKEKDLIIATDILKELDGLKLSSNSEVAFKARRAAILISRNLNNLVFNSSLDDISAKVDDKLIELTKSYAGELITNDVYLKVKAIANNVRTSGYGDNSPYSGIIYLDIAPDENMYSKELEYILETNQPPQQFTMKENQFLIIKNGDTKEYIKTYIYQGGELRELRYGSIKNKWINKITPRNLEQVCLFELLKNPEITILYASGRFGSGKSFLLNNYALQELEKGNISKIVYVPNNSYVANTMELGALPGELLDKVVGQIGPLIDLIGLDFVENMISRGELEVVPMSSIRGRSFENSIIIVNEAQNLTEEHVKLLIGRCGDGSRIFFDGDLRQADSAIFKNKNGLKLLLKLSDSEKYNKIFGTVRLEKVERSLTASAADYLDEIDGGV